MNPSHRLQDFKRKLESCNHGFVVTEFAVVLPSIVLLSAVFMWLLALCATQIRLEAAAGSIARQVSRVDSADSLIKNLRADGFLTHIQHDSDLILVTVEGQKHLPIKVLDFAIHLQATAQAPAEVN